MKLSRAIQIAKRIRDRMEILRMETRDKEASAPTPESHIEQALEIAFRYGSIDGEHHKTWVIDQMVRALTGENYALWVDNAKRGDDGPSTYSWDEGIAP